MASQLRGADRLLVPQVQAAISALTLTPADVAACELAVQYARQVDETPEDYRAVTLRDLGPKLLTCLTELGATPKARAAIKDGSGEDGEGTPLAKLRAARRR